MAYSSVRVQFEIGHEALVRTKKTPEGFTHDWEVFVRGADNTDIQYFVDKVIFHLHETFPKPKRVIKEPPYAVKESGYAGFLLPIDVYLKNKEEPKKISFQYDLTLQTSGPPVSRVLREPRLFQNPSEDFRLKLIRGGGVGVDTPADTHHDDFKSLNSLGGNKVKMGESLIKKHKPDLIPNDSFAELFGPPIRRTVEPKKIAEIPKKLSEIDPLKDKKKISKHGSYKEDIKKALKEKEKYVEKANNKEQDKNKEKLPKRPPSPPPAAPQIFKSKDDQKKHEEWKKKEHDEKKKRKEEREKKEKTKDIRTVDKPFEKEHKKDKKESKDFNHIKKINSLKLFETKPIYEKHNNENLEREKERIEKEKHKHRHKKKDKEKTKEKDKHRKDKDKNEKELREKQREKEKNVKKRHEEGREKEEKLRKKSRSPSPKEKLKKKPLNALLDELGSSDSASPLSEDEAMLSKLPAKVVPEIKSQSHVNVTPKLKSTNLNPPAENKIEKEIIKMPRVEDVNIKNKKEKSSSKKNKKSDKDNEKRRNKEDHKPCSLSSEKEDEDEEGPEKNSLVKEEKERLEADKPKVNRDKEIRKRKRDKSEEKHSKTKKSGNLENNLMPPQPIDLTESSDGIPREDKFTKEYLAQLRDLQHKITTLEDIAELQKVVKVIAETGKYEITQKTFDFDLCALDCDTVRRLQEFFSPT